MLAHKKFTISFGFSLKDWTLAWIGGEGGGGEGGCGGG